MRSRPWLSSRTRIGQRPEYGKLTCLPFTRSPNVISLAGFVGRTNSPTQDCPWAATGGLAAVAAVATTVIPIRRYAFIGLTLSAPNLFLRRTVIPCLRRARVCSLAPPRGENAAQGTSSSGLPGQDSSLVLG